jgi:hypothetical protein
MPIKDLRQDTLKPLPYFGTNNAQCIYWDRQLPGFGVRVFCEWPAHVCLFVPGSRPEALGNPWPRGTYY